MQHYDIIKVFMRPSRKTVEERLLTIKTKVKKNRSCVAKSLQILKFFFIGSNSLPSPEKACNRVFTIITF